MDIQSADSICETIVGEVKIFEEDYLDLKTGEQVARNKRYKAEVPGEMSTNGIYTTGIRDNIINNFNVDMSKNKTQFSDNYGSTNIDSPLRTGRRW